MTSKILIVEDEIKYAYIIEKYFLQANFEVKLAFDGMEAMEAFREFNPDIVCLDVMLPKMNGYEVATRIRQVSNVPIVMMSALSDDNDILKGYSTKIDDYITKPFRNNILVAKVEAILERRKELINENNQANIKPAYIVGHLKIVRETMECFVDDEIIKLTKTEFKLLEYLTMNVGQTCTRESIMNYMWDGKGADIRIIDTYIKKIRKLIVSACVDIVTVFGIGYRLEER